MLILTKEFLQDVSMAEIVRQKILKCMGDNDTAYIHFGVHKTEPDITIKSVKIDLPENNENDPAALERFNEKFARDNCANMTDEEWGDWIEALPRDEFMALITHPAFRKRDKCK